jgi:uncharacterized protein (DUF302 family)
MRVEQIGHEGGSAVDYDYRRDCRRGFEDAVASLEAALARHGFAVRVVHNIQAPWAAKGFAVKPIRIYEVDGPRDPSVAPAGEGQDERLARLMPCRINVFVDEDDVVITALRPTLLCRVFPDDKLDDVAIALERVLIAVVDEAVG